MEITRLIERCRQGDADALGELYKAYAQRMRGVCRRYISDEETVSDVLHDAFVIIFTSFDRLRDAKKAESWMMMINRHKPEAITELFEVVDGITYHTNVNFGSVSSTTLNYSYSGNIQSWWQTNLYLAGSYTRIPESCNKTHLLGGIISWNNRMSWERVGIPTMGLYCTSPTITGNSYQKGFASLDLSAERSFLKNALTIQIGVNDLLNGIKIRATNRVPTLNYDVCLKNQTRQVWCRLTYNFSTKAKTNKNSIQNDNSVKNRL
ncbi:MAG: outer membrane beta-barrel protein [Prevotella sp.]|nr:outer membrane beta-barrel protein [Prevotella sp.]